MWRYHKDKKFFFWIIVGYNELQSSVYAFHYPVRAYFSIKKYQLTYLRNPVVKDGYILPRVVLFGIDVWLNAVFNEFPAQFQCIQLVVVVGVKQDGNPFFGRLFFLHLYLAEISIIC